MTHFPEFDHLSDDDEVAFVAMVENFDDQLHEQLERANQNTDTRTFLLDYMNSVLAVARALNIETFNSWTTPDYDETYDIYARFSLFVKSYVLQLKLRKNRSSKTSSVELDAATKKRIHNLVAQIREAIENSDLDERKQNSLFDKLNKFEADVDRVRTPFDNGMRMAIEIHHVVEKYAKTLPINGFLDRILAILGAAKEKEPEPPALPRPDEKKRIQGPRKQIEGPKPSRNLDDDIPF
ncbi:hypothetical protein [Rhizobium sp. ICMP 5592]|uniref:hypothetical protein n=1 Tax=Rhizobium sp. ICMP 5592 TaxID=2292445 RepID=UPI0012970335|nr:hypothetical protein [Rhizobium sp. ICMP 5592]